MKNVELTFQRIVVSLVKRESSFPSSNAAKSSIGVFEAKLMATRANAVVSILRNSRDSPARSHPDLVISGSLKCPPSESDERLPADSQIRRTGENSRAMVRRVVGLVLCWIIYQKKGRDPPHGNGFILENFCKFVPLESLKRIPWIRWIENLAGAAAGLSKWKHVFRKLHSSCVTDGRH